MPPTAASQAASITTVTQFTGTTKSHAQRVLSMPQVQWNVERACDYILESGLEVDLQDEEEQRAAVMKQHAAASPANLPSGEISTWFSKYTSDGESIATQGLMQFCLDLNVDPEDVVLLVLVTYMKCKSSTEITREEFVRGMTDLRCHTAAQLVLRLPELRKSLSSDSNTFAAVYEHTYTWGLELGQKGMAKDVAVAYWSLLLPHANFVLYKEWIEFISASATGGVSKDLWRQVLTFAREINGDLDKFDVNGAWAFLLDEFVQHCRKAGE
jgi:hypothetical protein